MSAIIESNKLPFKKLISLTTPILIGQLTQMSMGLVDAIMAGQVNATNMAAVAIGSSIWLPFILFALGCLIALTPTVSFLNGAMEHTSIGHQVRQSYWLALLLGIPLFFIIYNAHFIINIMGMAPQLASISERYLQMMALGIPPYLIVIIFRSLTDGLSKTKVSMIISLIGVTLNVPLNYIFIYGKFGVPAMGAAGCGLASAIATYIMMFCLIHFSAKNAYMRRFKLFSPLIEPINGQTFRKLCRLGFPIGLTICAEVTFFSIVSLLLSPLGADVVATHQIALQTSSFIYSLPLSIGMASTILVGNALGNKNPQLAKNISRQVLWLGFYLTILTALATLLLRQSISELFIDNEKIVQLASFLLIFAAIYQIPDAIQAISGGILRAYKDTRSILIITLISYWVIAMPIGYTLGLTNWIIPHIGAEGFWIGFVISLSCASLLLLHRLHKIQRIPDDKLLMQLDKIK